MRIPFLWDLTLRQWVIGCRVEGMQLRADAQPCPIKSDCVILPLCYTGRFMSHVDKKKIIAGSAIHTKHSNELRGHNLESFNFKLGGTYSNVHLFIHSFIPQSVLRQGHRFQVSSINFHYPLVSLTSSSSSLRLHPHLSVTTTLPFNKVFQKAVPTQDVTNPGSLPSFYCM